MWQRIKRFFFWLFGDDINRIILFLWFLTGLGLFSLLVLAINKVVNHDWPGAIKLVGTGLFLAGAATVGGGLVGFLFGVPRHRVDPDSGKPPAYQPNTNLEQISDWLTKIIVGVGLTQFPHILDFIAGFGRFAGPAFSEPPVGEIIAVCLLLHYVVAGFFQGFLIAYLWLPRAYARAAREAEAAALQPSPPSIGTQEPAASRADTAM